MPGPLFEVVGQYEYDDDLEAFAAQQQAEIEAENGWLRAAEYSPEARDEMEREDALGLYEPRPVGFRTKS